MIKSTYALGAFALVVGAFVACGGPPANTPTNPTETADAGGGTTPMPTTTGTGTTPETPDAGGGEATDAGGPSTMGPPKTFDEQVAMGQKLYADNCADCHGASGDGKGDVQNAPPVVGLDKGALPLHPPKDAKYRKSDFKTAADVADFVVKTMPPSNPNSLTVDQKLAILAFDLKANGVTQQQPLDADNIKTIVIHK